MPSSFLNWWIKFSSDTLALAKEYTIPGMDTHIQKLNTLTEPKECILCAFNVTFAFENFLDFDMYLLNPIHPVLEYLFNSLGSLYQCLCPSPIQLTLFPSHQIPTLYQESIAIYGEDIIECLLWRNGAIMYNYIHSNAKKLTQIHDVYLTQGLYYLIHMIYLRDPSIYESPCEGVEKKLADAYIFSETHILAHAYAGELTWYYFPHQDDLLNCGIEILKRYIRIVREILPTGHAWEWKQLDQYLRAILYDK